MRKGVVQNFPSYFLTLFDLTVSCFCARCSFFGDCSRNAKTNSENSVTFDRTLTRHMINLRMKNDLFRTALFGVSKCHFARDAGRNQGAIIKSMELT